MRRTATQRLADLVLGQSVVEWATPRREEGKSWRLIARELFLATEGEIDVTEQTLRSWAAAPMPAPAARPRRKAS